MNDEQLAKMIKENFERDMMLETIGQNVMKRLKHEKRRATMRKIASVFAVTFGAALILTGFGAVMVQNIQNDTSVKSTVIFVAIILIAFVAWTRIITRFITEKI